MTTISTAFTYYLDSYRGFSAPVWWLALATLVNRAGAMVLPFLSLYLTSSLGFTLSEVGWVMTFFGIGSFVGAWLGGELSHRIGAYRTMILSLVLSAGCFVMLGYMRQLGWICAGMFLTSLVADLFRPAVFVSLATYARPENRTRAITLIRLAINLGFAMGPALGGLIIVASGYGSLFWIDGATCFIAGLLIFLSLKEKPQVGVEESAASRHSHARILGDHKYMLFLLGLFLFGALFFQFFSTIPVYYKTVRLLSEDEVGWLLSLNGLLIFFTEMPLIYALEKPGKSNFRIIIFSALLLAGSYVAIVLHPWNGLLIVGMVLATVAEMLCFPFTNSYAMERGGRGNEGRYMAYYSMTFSLSHILGHNLGMQTSALFGFDVLFAVMIFLSLVSGTIFWWVGKSSH